MGGRRTRIRKTRLNIGLQEIKWTKLLKFMTTWTSLPEIGKVLSFGSILRVAEDLKKRSSKV